ncbi:MAG: class I SAM-dependent methyltransferase [Gemmatimonadales bacterium]
MSATAPVALEAVPCPLGCAPDDEIVVRGHDRLHELPGEFTVVRCRGCGLLRTTPRPTPEAMGFYYPAEYGPYLSTRVLEDAPAPPAAPRPAGAIRRWIRETKTHIVPPLTPGRMLEVGCGSGAYLHEMAARGWAVEGLEFSPDAAAAARALGYQVRVGALETAADPAAPYDLIAGWMVVEHLHDPLGGLRKLARWTRPGGWLALSTPDAAAPEFKLFGDAWYALHLPNHLYLYDHRTLRRVLAESGWELRRVFWHDNPNNLLMSLRFWALDRGRTGLAEWLLDVAECRRWPRARLVLGKLLGALRASGRMTVWARRV